MWTMLNVLVRIYQFLGNLNPLLGPMVAVFTIGMFFVEYMNDMWAVLFAEIDSMVIPLTEGALDFSPLAFINYTIPLDTLFTLLTAYGSLMLACYGVRIVKSFLPTIN